MYNKDTERLLREELETLLTPVLVTAGIVNVIYRYRTTAGIVRASLSFSPIETISMPEVLAGDSALIDLRLVGQVVHENSEADLEAAEDTCGEIAGILYETLAKSRNSVWRKVSFVSPGARPAFPDSVMTRIVTVDARFHIV